MQAHHFPVNGFVVIIIIPVNQSQVIRRFFFFLPLIVLRKIVVGRVFVGKLEVHVAPDHRMKIEFPAVFHYACQMALKNLDGILVSVLQQIASRAESFGLVHTQMDPAGRKAFPQRAEHGADQIAGLLILGEQDIVRVSQIL